MNINKNQKKLGSFSSLKNLGYFPAMMRVAEIALYERIQKTFNLHPSKMVEDIRRYAAKNNKDPVEVAQILKKSAGMLFGVCTYHIRRVLDGERSLNMSPMCFDIPFGKEMIEYFNLAPNKIAREMEKKAEAEGFDAKDFAVNLHSEIPWIVADVFDRTIEILQPQ